MSFDFQSQDQYGSPVAETRFDRALNETAKQSINWDQFQEQRSEDAEMTRQSDFYLKKNSYSQAVNQAPNYLSPSNFNFTQASFPTPLASQVLFLSSSNPFSDLGLVEKSNPFTSIQQSLSPSNFEKRPSYGKSSNFENIFKELSHDQLWLASSLSKKLPTSMIQKSQIIEDVQLENLEDIQAKNGFESIGSLGQQGKIGNEHDRMEEKSKRQEGIEREKRLETLQKNDKKMKDNFEGLFDELKGSKIDQAHISRELKQLKEETVKNIEAGYEKSRAEGQMMRDFSMAQIQSIKEDLRMMKKEREQDLLLLEVNKNMDNLETIVLQALNRLANEYQCQDNRVIKKKILNELVNSEEKKENTLSRVEIDYSGKQNQIVSAGSESKNIWKRNNGESQAPKRRRSLQERKDSLSQKASDLEKKLEEIKKVHIQSMRKFNVSSGFQLENKIPLTSQPLPFDDNLHNTISHHPSLTYGSPFDIAYCNPQIEPPSSNFPLSNSLTSASKRLHLSDLHLFPLENLPHSLTNSNSLLYSHFQFSVTSFFQVRNDLLHPLLCTVTMNNLSMLNLLDLLILPFASQAADLLPTHSKAYTQELAPNLSLAQQVSLDKNVIQNGGFQVLISYRTHISAKRKTILRIPLPILYLMKPEPINQDQFMNAWDILPSHTYVSPQLLTFKYIQSHQDLQLLLPFLTLSESDSNTFSYGLLFKYPTIQYPLLIKLLCFVNGQLSLHLKYQNSVPHSIVTHILHAFAQLLFTS